MIDKYSYAASPIVLLFGKNNFFLATILTGAPTDSDSIAGHLCGSGFGLRPD
jgi:hypothetical protein